MSDQPPKYPSNSDVPPYSPQQPQGHYGAPQGYPPQQPYGQQPYGQYPSQYPPPQNANNQGGYYQSTTTTTNYGAVTPVPTQQVIVVREPGVNHALHCLITLFFFPWIIVWIILCITEDTQPVVTTTTYRS